MRHARRSPVEDHLLLEDVLIVERFEDQRKDFNDRRVVLAEELLERANKMPGHEFVRITCDQNLEGLHVLGELATFDDILIEEHLHHNVRASREWHDQLLLVSTHVLDHRCPVRRLLLEELPERVRHEFGRAQLLLLLRLLLLLLLLFLRLIFLLALILGCGAARLRRRATRLLVRRRAVLVLLLIVIFLLLVLLLLLLLVLLLLTKVRGRGQQKGQGVREAGRGDGTHP